MLDLEKHSHKHNKTGQPCGNVKKKVPAIAFSFIIIYQSDRQEKQQKYDDANCQHNPSSGPVVNFKNKTSENNNSCYHTKNICLLFHDFMDQCDYL